MRVRARLGSGLALGTGCVRDLTVRIRFKARVRVRVGPGFQGSRRSGLEKLRTRIRNAVG